MATATRSSRAASSSEGLIGRSARVRGRIVGEGDLRVDGAVAGDVVLDGALTVGESGEVQSNVQASTVEVLGSLEGDVTARGAITLGPSARVRGDLRGSRIAIEAGASYAGRLDADFDLPPELSTKGSRRGR